MKLNTLCGHFVSLFDMPMSDFTELQRALKEQSPHFDPDNELNQFVRARAEETGTGHDPAILRGKAGPGGGIEVDPFRAAFFLLAVALNGPRKESAQSTWLTFHLNQEGSVLSGWGEDFKPTFTECPLTGQHLFGEALMAILDSVELARRVTEVRVSSNLHAEIHFDDNQVSKFEKSYGDKEPNLRRDSVLQGFALQAVAMLIKRAEA